MQLTYKYRLNPTSAQRTALNATLEASRWVYNKTLEVRKEAWEQRKESVSYYDSKKMIPTWKAEHPCLSQAHSQVLQNASMRVDLALQAFFRRVKKGETPGYPRFRGRNRYDSFTFPQYESGWKFTDDGHLRLFKIGDVKIKLHRPIAGKIKTLTIQRDTLGNWYACFSCAVEFNAPDPSLHVAGIDMGLEKFATLSTGVIIDNPRFFRKDEKALATAQRKLSALPKGTKEREKAKRAVQHIHARIANRRKDFAHKLSRYLVDVFQVVVFEDLNVQGMVRNHSLAKSISDAAWNQTIQYTTYKAECADRLFLKVNPAYTSQDCSTCGDRVKKSLSQRVHSCPKCGLEIDRDLNAALNILARGLAGIGTNP
jgi:putative transposase